MVQNSRVVRTEDVTAVSSKEKPMRRADSIFNRGVTDVITATERLVNKWRLIDIRSNGCAGVCACVRMSVCAYERVCVGARLCVCVREKASVCVRE